MSMKSEIRRFGATRLGAIAMSLSLGALASPAMAQVQPPADEPAEDAPPAEAPPADAPAGGRGSLFEDDARSRDKDKNVPVAAMPASARAKIQEMRTALSSGEKKLDDARKSKDSVQLDCVNEGLTQMKSMLRLAEGAYSALENHVANGNADRARFEFRKVGVAHRKMVELSASIRNCVGADATYAGSTEVELVIDDSIANQDPYYGSSDLFFTPADGVVDSNDGSVGSNNSSVQPPPPPATGFQ